jgi:hypothetical protein
VSEISTSAFDGVTQVVEPWQGFSKENRCPICGGYREAPGADCHGYLSRDSTWVYCTRECRAEPVGGLEDRPPVEIDLEDHHAWTLSSAELLELSRSPSEWLVEGRLPRGGTSILTGEAQAGKSTLARELAVSVARGAPWLGFETARGSVLYLHLERDPAELRCPFERLGLTPRDDVHFLNDVADAGLLERIRDRARELEPSLIVLDGVESLLRAEESRPGSQTSSPLDRVLGLAEATGAHVLLVHGLERDSVRGMSRLLGSTARPVDTILLIHRSGGRRSLRSIQRRGEDLDAAVPVPPFGAAAPGSAFPRGPAPPSPAVEAATPSTGPIREQILEYLGRIAKLATQQDIVESTGFPPSEVRPALKALRDRGKVLELGRGTRDEPYLYTGCDVLAASARSPWLRKVRPWAMEAELGSGSLAASRDHRRPPAPSAVHGP